MTFFTSHLLYLVIVGSLCSDYGGFSSAFTVKSTKYSRWNRVNHDTVGEFRKPIVATSSNNLISGSLRRGNSFLMAQVSQQEAQSGINKVVNVLKKDRRTCDELGKLVKVTNVLGFGSPKPGTLAVRFNAQFKKGGMGRQAVPMPFGLGQTNKSEGRGVMVGQVKASIDTKSGKVLNCSVFRDLGYGRSFDLKC